MNQRDNRTELQKKLDNDLRAKALAKTKLENKPIEIEDNAYMKDTKQTTTLASVWLMIFIMTIVVIGLVVYFGKAG